MNKEKKHSKKCSICGRPTHKISKYCIFHASAEEKTEEEFKKALKKYIDKIKKEDDDYNFEKFIFVGDINFKKDINVTIFKNVNFQRAIFNGYVDFSDTIFKGNAIFFYAKFYSTAEFTGVTFKEGASFTFANFIAESMFVGVNFNGFVGFSRTIFNGGAAFVGANFKEDIYFRGTVFGNYGYFNGIAFEKDVKFYNVTFMGEVGFNNATFKGDAYFEINNINGCLYFNGSEFVHGKTLNLSIKNNPKKKILISFKKACLENVYLELSLKKEILINFSDALLRNTKFTKSQIEKNIIQEERKEFSQAREIYILLKNNFHSIGRYEDEGWAFKKIKDMDRLACSIICYIDNKNENKYYSSIYFYSNLIENYFDNYEGYQLGNDFANKIYFYTLLIFRYFDLYPISWTHRKSAIIIT